MFPSAQEKYERRTEVELEKLERDGSSEMMTKEEQRAYNRALFLNLPKTPSTPFHNSQFPMTPRTVAFTQLSGGKQPDVTVSSAGPSRKLPFREHYAPTD